MPAANPTRPFPYNPFWPIYDNLRIMLRSRPLAVAVVGIAFFTFVVAYMRAVMYMHGQTRNPPWNELDTSLVVGTVMFGLGLGSPLAGVLSSGKVELGLVPFGGIGMILILAVGSFVLGSTAALIACLIVVGFCTGFYLVPLYTLLQFRAPKQSKGDLLATSNIINVIGAMAASGLFAVLLNLANWSGITPTIQPVEDFRGRLVSVERDNHGHITKFQVEGRPEYVAGDNLVIKRREGYEVPLVAGSEIVLGKYQMERQGKLTEHILIQLRRKSNPTDARPAAYHWISVSRCRGDDPLHPIFVAAALARSIFAHVDLDPARCRKPSDHGRRARASADLGPGHLGDERGQL